MKEQVRNELIGILKTIFGSREFIRYFLLLVPQQKITNQHSQGQNKNKSRQRYNVTSQKL